MKSFKYTILIVTALFFSCGNNQKDNDQVEKDIYDEVIAIHDEVMPKMSILLSLESQLEKKVQELDSGNENSAAEIGLLIDQIMQLQAADEAMMQWMRNFQVDQEGWSHDSVMSYMENEKKSISMVRETMLEIIDSSEKLLGIRYGD